MDAGGGTVEPGEEEASASEAAGARKHFRELVQMDGSFHDGSKNAGREAA